MFELHPRLDADTLLLGQFDLCELRLMNDARYPWVILVPRRDNISEIHQLSSADQQLLMTESSFVSATMAALFQADKMNIAALGNVVPQLHIHHVARFKTDETWPDPVWGKGQAQPYDSAALQQRIEQLQSVLKSQMSNGQ